MNARILICGVLGGFLSAVTLIWPLYLLLPTRYTNDWLNASAALGFTGVLLAVATAGGAGYAAARWGWAVAIRDRVQAARWPACWRG